MDITLPVVVKLPTVLIFPVALTLPTTVKDVLGVVVLIPTLPN